MRSGDGGSLAGEGRVHSGGTDPATLWERLRGELLEQFGSGRTDRWFGGVTARIIEDGRLVLAAPNAFIAEWITDTYGARIEEIARGKLGLDGVRLIVAPPRIAPPTTPTDAAEAGGAKADHGARGTNCASDQGTGNQSTGNQGTGNQGTGNRGTAARSASPQRSAVPESLRDVSPSLTLERFIVGRCNRVAYHAGLEALRRPGGAYNPIFIYGGCGLGKTHLLQGITREYFRQGERRIRYLPCEGFVNRFGQSVRHREIDRFRERFRSLRVLVLDDIQVVAGKERSQLELLETIDRIAAAGGQVVLASDSRPADLQGLAEKLLGRFISGLVCRVGEPDIETRLAILRQEARAAGIAVPEETLRCLAERFEGNIRELIGTWVRVLAHGSLLGEPITPHLVEGVLEDAGAPTSRVTISDIIEEVGRRYGVPPVEFRGPGRSRTVSLARHVVIYLSRVLTDHSLAEIGALLGGRKHATASAAYRKIQRALTTDEQLRIEVERLLSTLRRG